MASIPTIPGTDVSPSVTPAESPSLAVQIDATPGLKARGAMADAVTTAATVIGDYEDKKQKLQEFDIANKSYLSFTKLKQEFDKQIDTTPHDQLENKWNQMSSDWRSQQEEQYKGKLTREAQMEIGNHWDTAITGVNGQVNVIATRKFHEEVLSTVDAVYNHAAQSLDPDTIAAAKAQGAQAVKNGSATKGYIEDRNSKLDTRAQEEEIEAARIGTIDDKLKTIERLKNKDDFKNIPALRRPAFINQLNGAIASQQTQNGEVYTDIVASGPPNTWPTEKQLHEDVSSKKISADRERAILGTIYAKTKAIKAEELKIKREQDANAVAVINNLISNHDWGNDPNPDSTYQTISDASANLEERLRAPILKEAATKRDQAKNKLKSGESKEDSPVEKEIMRKGEEDFKAGLFLPPIKPSEFMEGVKEYTKSLPHWLQPTIEKLQPKYDTTWEKKSTTEEIEAAYSRYAVWQDAMRKHIKEQKAKAAKTGDSLSLSELNNYSYSLKQDYLEKAVSNKVF